MSIRNAFFNTMRRKGGSYIPFEFSLCPALLEEFRKRTGRVDYAEYYQFPARAVWAQNTSAPDRFNKYYAKHHEVDIKSILVEPEWGVGRVQGSMAHFSKMQHPMSDFESLEEFISYPYPDPILDYDWVRLKCDVEKLKARDLITIAPMQMTVFETAWYLRGMENLLMDMINDEEYIIFLLDKITEIRCEMARRYAFAGCDVLQLGDDVSTQLDMMMDPDLWRRYFKDRLARIICVAKDVKPDMMIFYHGDGNLQKIIPDLIEIGIDILNPIQPECMDPVEIKRMYGERLSFWGAVGTQTTLPFGKPEDVRRVCLDLIEKLGNGGGFLLAPTHVVEPEVPWENLQVLIDVVNEYNKGS